MGDGWHDLEVFRERQRELLREAENLRLARSARRGLNRPGGYGRLLRRVAVWLSEPGSRVAPSPSAPPPEGEVIPLRTSSGLVEAVFEEKSRSSSVTELLREAEGYVIREVNLGTGGDTFYLSTEEKEWAAWIWERKTRRLPETRT